MDLDNLSIQTAEKLDSVNQTIVSAESNIVDAAALAAQTVASVEQLKNSEVAAFKSLAHSAEIDNLKNDFSEFKTRVLAFLTRFGH